MQCFIYILVSLVLCVSCSKDLSIEEPISHPTTVSICFGDDESRTAINADGVSTSWTKDDRISVWAENNDGSYYFENQNFLLTSYNNKRGFFSTTLASQMAEGIYTYYATYPNPKSIMGTTAAFTLPSIQNGKAGEGADILVATPLEYTELKPLPIIEDHSTMSMRINHMMHILRFYTPEGNTKMGGEAIERIIFTMTPNVTGEINVNFKDASVRPVIYSNGGNKITLNLNEKLEPSSQTRKYAYAAICPLPQEASAGSSISIKIYSESRIGTLSPINIAGRTFDSGHATSIALDPQSVSRRCKMYFNVMTNNLGENIQTITLSAPSGCQFPDGSNTYVYNPGTDITPGHSFYIDFEDENMFRTFSSKSITVTYDSVHARVTETKNIPNLSSVFSCTTALNIPYLLFEDFSSIGDISSNDAHKTSSAGSKNGVEFLLGWSGARFGASAGRAVRIACRRETSADYDARMVSKVLGIKANANLRIQFNYSGNRQEGGLGEAKAGQTCFIGFTTTTGVQNSEDTEGTFSSDNSFFLNETTGSYSNINHEANYVLENVSPSARVVWRTEVEHHAGLNNSTVWLYIDNVKVQIAQ